MQIYMVSFVDGPASEVVLNLSRIPTFLRVVCAGEQWDALDQLDDEPAPNEVIYAYISTTPKPNHVHVCGRENGKRFSRWYCRVKYALCEQPADDVMRDREKWRAWCLSQTQARQVDAESE